MVLTPQLCGEVVEGGVGRTELHRLQVFVR